MSFERNTFFAPLYESLQARRCVSRCSAHLWPSLQHCPVDTRQRITSPSGHSTDEHVLSCFLSLMRRCSTQFPSKSRIDASSVSEKHSHIHDSAVRMNPVRASQILGLGTILQNQDRTLSWVSGRVLSWRSFQHGGIGQNRCEFASQATSLRARVSGRIAQQVVSSRHKMVTYRFFPSATAFTYPASTSMKNKRAQASATVPSSSPEVPRLPSHHRLSHMPTPPLPLPLQLFHPPTTSAAPPRPPKALFQVSLSSPPPPPPAPLRQMLPPTGL